MRILVTRAEPDATATATALRRLGHTPLVSPLSQIVFLDAPWPELMSDGAANFQAILLTSRNAARASQHQANHDSIADIPVFAVGNRCAETTHAAGFGKVYSADGTVKDLVRLVSEKCETNAGPLLYLAGQTRKPDLETSLSAGGYDLETRIVYRIDPDIDLSEAARSALRDGNIDGVLVYSAQSARTLVAKLQGCGLTSLDTSVTVHCLSADIADELKDYVQGPIKIADRPTESHLLATLRS